MKYFFYLALSATLGWHSVGNADLAADLKQANSEFRSGSVASAQRQLETILNQTSWNQPDQVAVKFQTIQSLSSLYRDTLNVEGLINVSNQLVEFVYDSGTFSEMDQLTKSMTYAMAGLNRWTSLLHTGTQTALEEIEEAYQSPGFRQPTRSYNHQWLSPYFESFNFLYGQHLNNIGRRTDADLVVHRAVVGAAIEEGRNPLQSHWTLMRLADHYLQTGRLARAGEIISFLGSAPTFDMFWQTNPTKRSRWLNILFFHWVWTGKKQGYEHLIEELESFLSEAETDGATINSQHLYSIFWSWKILAAETGNTDEFDRIEFLQAKYDLENGNADDIFFKTRLALKADRPVPEFPSDELLEAASGATNHFPEMLHLARSNQYQMSGDLDNEISEGINAFQVMRDKYHATQLPNLWTVQPYRFYSMATESLIEVYTKLAAEGPLGTKSRPDVLADVIETQLRMRSPNGAFFAGAREKIYSKKIKAAAKVRELLVKQYELFLDQMIGKLMNNVLSAPTWTPAPSAPSDKQLQKERTIFYEFLQLTQELYAVDQGLWSTTPEYFSDARLSVVSYQDLVDITDQESAIVWLTFDEKGDELLRLCFNGDKFFLSKRLISRQELIKQIRAMRQPLTSYQSVAGLALNSQARGFSVQPSSNESPSGFLETSKQLFDAVFSGLDDCAGDKSELLLRTDPIFYSLPINALVIDREDSSSPRWFFDRYAYEFLSSVNPRIEPHQTEEYVSTDRRQAFIGVGDFIPHGQLAQVQPNQRSVAVRGASLTADLTGLAPLPGTRTELESMAESFGQSSSQLFLGENATEKNFRQSQPERFSTIAFATHGVVAGEFDGLSEPALVLTKGVSSSSFDDGILTSSELGSIDLNADLVILSACNTALSDGTPNAQGLGALANSFLFSGAKAAVVSQWPVNDEVAPLITRKIVQEMISDQSIGQSLRFSLQSLVEDSANIKFHHPSFWAPFIPISQGAKKSTIVDESEPLRKNWETVNEEGHLSEAQAVAVSRDRSIVISQGFMHSTIDQQTAHGWLDLQNQKNGSGARIVFPDLASGGDVIVDKQGNLVSIWTTIFSDNANKIDSVIIKMDPDGKEIWRKQLGESSRGDFPKTIVNLPNGSYVVFMSVEDHENPSMEFWAYLLGANGVVKDKQKLASFPPGSLFDPNLNAVTIGQNKVLVSWANGSTGEMVPAGSPITGISNEDGFKLVHDSVVTVLRINFGKFDIGEIKTYPKIAIRDLVIEKGRVFALADRFPNPLDRTGSSGVYEINVKGRELNIVELFNIDGITADYPKKLMVLSTGEFVTAGFFMNMKKYEPMEFFEETASNDREDNTIDMSRVADFLAAKEFNPDQVFSAFVSVFDRSGNLVDDFVSVSPTGASFLDGVLIDGNSFVAVGGGGKQGSTVARFTLH